MGTEIWDVGFPAMLLTFSSITVSVIFVALAWSRSLSNDEGRRRNVPLSLRTFASSIGFTLAGYVFLVLNPIGILTEPVGGVLTLAIVAYLIVLIWSFGLVCVSLVLARSDNGPAANTIVHGSKVVIGLYLLGFSGIAIGMYSLLP